MTVNPLFLIGIGQDSHRLRPSQDGEHLHLAGVAFDCGLTLEAHSDGDVILHALYNAISTALGGGSLGAVADELCAQGVTDSSAYLQVVLAAMRERQYALSNISISIEAAQPRLEKYFPPMKNALARLGALPREQIGLAATSGEALSACGRGEGMSVIASVLLQHQ